MGKYARGKKSYAISDISGLRVKYTKLKTTWDGLRVSPEDYEPKHPQLTPAKNVVDATALFNGRPDNDPDNVVVYIGFTQDWTIDPRARPPVGVPSIGEAGYVDIHHDRILSVSGVSGSANVGTASVSDNEDLSVTGTSGTGATGSESFELEINETGVSGTGSVGTTEDDYLQYSITVANSGSGNRYYVDSVLQQQLYLQEGKTYRFDQSNSSNSGHPIRLSTTPNGTHGGGSEYTTGVTTNGTPGSSGAYTEITVASGAPTLYYYCTNHSNMGGTSYTPSSGTISLAITVANPGSGNKYYIDNGSPAPTISITEGTTYRFDQSDSSNNNHPLRFSTTSGGTHGGGSEYTTGVTTNGTPGNVGAYTQISVASNAPTLYYYCTNHSGMGGQLNTPSITVVSGQVIALEINESGVSGTGATGTSTFFITTDAPVSGTGGTSAVGTEVPEIELTETGVGGTGAIGNETFEGSPSAIGAVGTGAIGSEVPELELSQSGVSGDGESEGFGVSGNGNIQLLVTGISGIGSTGAVGEEVSASEAIETGLGGSGAVGSVSLEISLGWSEGTWGSGTWGN